MSDILIARSAGVPACTVTKVFEFEYPCPDERVPALKYVVLPIPVRVVSIFFVCAVIEGKPLRRMTIEASLSCSGCVVPASSKTTKEPLVEVLQESPSRMPVVVVETSSIGGSFFISTSWIADGSKVKPGMYSPSTLNVQLNAFLAAQQVAQHKQHEEACSAQRM